MQVNDLQVGKFLRNSGQHLKSKGGAVCSLGSTGGGYCVWPLYIKSDRKPVGLPFRRQTEHISMLSLVQTYIDERSSWLPDLSDSSMSANFLKFCLLNIQTCLFLSGMEPKPCVLRFKYPTLLNQTTLWFYWQS